MQGLRIIKDNEQLVLASGDGWRIFGRRVPGKMYSDFTAKHTDRRGITSWAMVGYDVMMYAITGWEGLHDGEQYIAFSQDVKATVIDALAQETQAEIISTASSEAAEQLRGDLKNSPTSHDSKPITTA